MIHSFLKILSKCISNRGTLVFFAVFIILFFVFSSLDLMLGSML